MKNQEIKLHLLDLALRSTKLSPMAKLTYWSLLSMIDEDGKCYPTNVYLGEMHNVSQSTSKRSIKELVDAKFIETRNKRGDLGESARIITVLF